MVSRRVVGVLSGTSMDGIDVAAAALRLVDDTVEMRPLGSTRTPYPEALRRRLLAALPPGRCTAEELCVLDTEVGRCFASAARRGVGELADGQADLVACLGQTLYHWVPDGHPRGTLQLGQPAWIAEATGLPVVADLRARDVAAGGHGAPLAAIFDALWLADRPGTNVALNIGGIANITVVGGTSLVAYDTGPGNALIDAAASTVTSGRQARDTDGAIAASGSVRKDLLDALLADPYYALLPPKSTGKEHFNREYLRDVLADFENVDDADLLATLTELTATTIARACHSHVADRVVVSGGGVANPSLLTALRDRLSECDTELLVSDDLGLPAESKEAYLTALLGFLTFHGLPGTVRRATGAEGPRVLGAITPGHGPLVLPEPASHRPRRLRVQNAREET